MITQWLIETWTVINLSAPWLLIGFFCAGIIHAVLPNGIIKKHLKTPGFSSVLKGSVYGIPLPLCSCSVIPVGVSLRKQGTSKGATASFFVSTPEIGIDSFLLSFFLLGPVFAVSRVVATFLSAMGVGILIDRFSESDSSRTGTHGNEHTSCCQEAKADSNRGAKPQFGYRVRRKIRDIFHFAYVEIFDDIVVVLSLGFVGAGLVSVFIPDNLFMDLNLHPILMMFIMLIAALPVYVCATSSTPFAAALLAKGLDPGAAIVFLLVGPATNITTMLTIGRELGKRELVIYLSVIILISMLFGIAINQFPDLLGHGNYLNFKGDSMSHDHMSGIPGLLVFSMLTVSLIKKLANYIKKESNGDETCCS